MLSNHEHSGELGDEFTSEVASQFTDDFVDGCDLDFRQDVLDDAESDLFVLFAEALDSNSPRTVAESAAVWEALFS